MILYTKLRKRIFSDRFNYEYGLTKKEIELIRRDYKLRFVKEKVPAIVIFCLDNRSYSYGFADRLRGIISCYAFAKAIGVPFRIEHINPFDLSEFLMPNVYDWQLKEGEKSYNLLYANPVCFVQNRIDLRSMRLFRLKKKRQHHLYTNASYIKEVNDKYNKNYEFGDLFSELFKPSLVLEKKIKEQKEQIRGKYISVSFRFVQLMGDFKDDNGEILIGEDKTNLLKKSLSVVMSLYDKNQKTILVTSDSQTFLTEVSRLDHVYVVSGKIGHIGYSQDKEVFEKMFLDFFLISQADHVYMAYAEKMYRSNFAKTAALANKIPYTEIAF